MKRTILAGLLALVSYGAEAKDWPNVTQISRGMSDKLAQSGLAEHGWTVTERRPLSNGQTDFIYRNACGERIALRVIGSKVDSVRNVAALKLPMSEYVICDSADERV